jgi:hypothetical protein
VTSRSTGVHIGFHSSEGEWLAVSGIRCAGAGLDEIDVPWDTRRDRGPIQATPDAQFTSGREWQRQCPATKHGLLLAAGDQEGLGLISTVFTANPRPRYEAMANVDDPPACLLLPGGLFSTYAREFIEIAQGLYGLPIAYLKVLDSSSTARRVAIGKEPRT